ncbi:uncharacterized protein LOC127129878 [Lathyrus oleraceus]|uniref:uncharacterized protein LOC127129878 n=1 Tax=Pisum sativum TaxID=3888 RepID=UPI0021D1A04D|nr:uncharacterized protein LOC127129878 [Pisum sativum]
MRLSGSFSSYTDHVSTPVPNQPHSLELRITPMNEVGWELKSQKLTPPLIGPYQILRRPNDVKIRHNLTYEIPPLLIEDRNVKHSRGKEIPLVKVLWGKKVDGSVTWELESQMKESYPSLSISGKLSRMKIQ